MQMSVRLRRRVQKGEAYGEGADYELTANSEQATTPSSKHRTTTPSLVQNSTEQLTKNEGFVDASMIVDPDNNWKCGRSKISLDPDHDEISGDPGLGEISGGRLAEPHAFPWIVLACARLCCAGTLITNKHVLTAFHCATNEDYCTPVDYSNGYHKIILGRNHIPRQNHIPDPDDDSLYTIPIIDVKFPEYPGLAWNTNKMGWDSDCKGQKQINRRTEIYKGHDFAMLILKEKVKFS